VVQFGNDHRNKSIYLRVEEIKSEKSSKTTIEASKTYMYN